MKFRYVFSPAWVGLTPVFALLCILGFAALPVRRVPAAGPVATVQSGQVDVEFDAYVSKQRFKVERAVTRDISGEIDLDQRVFHVVVDLRKLSTRSTARDREMHRDVLETKRFPKADYQGRIEAFDADSGAFRLRGTLVCHGVTKTDFVATGTARRDAAGYQVQAEFPLNLRDFQITPPSNMMVLRVGDVVRVRVNAVVSGGGNK